MNSRASLAQQRTLLQNQLRAQRAKIVAQLCEEKNHNAHFPRSATMRFFTGKMGMKLVTDIAVQQLYVRHPGTVAITQGLSRWLSRMLTAKLLPQV